MKDSVALRCGCTVTKLDRFNTEVNRCALHVNNDFRTTLIEARFQKDPGFPKAYRLFYR
jgi:hypothetical protein